MAKGDTKTNQYLDIAANGSRADLPSETCCETRSQTLIRGVAERIMDVEDELERLENNPDVADIVATYADLQSYPTSQLTDKDVIRVLQDETHDGESTYYRWSTSSQTWAYIGESKQYTNFVGTDGTSAGTSGLVPAPAVTDADKFLKSDGTWAEASGGSSINVVQTTGTSQADVMSQKAVTDMIFSGNNTGRIRIGSTSLIGAQSVVIGANASTNANNSQGDVAIGPGAGTASDGSVAIGQGAKAGPASYSYSSTATAIGRYATASGGSSIALGGGFDFTTTKATASGSSSIAIGSPATASSTGSIAIGESATASGLRSIALGGSASGNRSIALGIGSSATTAGEVNVGNGTATNLYNGTGYRLLTGLHDGQSAHDAATYGQLDTRLDGLTLLKISQTDYDNLQSYDANTLYVITGA